ncbi:hypothetical protein TrCOL_g8995 [Triparma columacea]|uniref:MATE efflux family protein n=1 Tax=Triparma columacea TaxID=722753 RepID=A0A9W7GMZ1_9STRA|nr:hypothetical protein TrCOL_g8995 [Triparma columacea]
MEDTATPTKASVLSALTNLILDPILMFGLGMEARGQILRSILTSNISMLLKQSSLLLAWAYSTRRAALLGSKTAAAHQIGLTSWLLFALVSEGPSIATQVIAAKEGMNEGTLGELFWYTCKLAIVVGVGCSLCLKVLEPVILGVFTNDVKVRLALKGIMKPIVLIQPLITATLMLEGMAIGGGKYKTLAIGNVASTVWSIGVINRSQGLGEVWGKGIVALFLGRLGTAVWSVRGMRRGRDEERKEEE